MFNLKYLAFSLLGTFLMSCANHPTSTTETAPKAIVAGEYVSSDYEKRHQGYDWVAVTVIPADDSDHLKINIHSRKDIKKQTCRLETIAKKIDNSRYTSTQEGAKILFHFSNNQLTISPLDGNYHQLMYFCSGGASIVGDYHLLQKKSL